MTQKDENWQVTTDRFVAFFDILGFTNMVEQKSHEEVVERLGHVKRIIQTVIDGTLKTMPMHTNLKSVIFSDCFLVISKSDSFKDLLHVLHQCRIVVKYCVGEGIAMKGAVSYGKFTADFKNSLFVGKPLIDAYNLHNELKMIGAVLDPHAERKRNEFSDVAEYKKYLDYELLQYRVPTQQGAMDCYTIKWPELIIPPLLDNKPGYMLMLQDKKKTEKLYDTATGKAKIYVDNTMAFIEHIIQHGYQEHPDMQVFIPPPQNL